MLKPRCYNENEIVMADGEKNIARSSANRNEISINRNGVCAGVAQLGEQQTEELSILEVPCSIHGPGIFFFYIQNTAAYLGQNIVR